MSSPKGTAKSAGEEKDIKQARRRLSVMSDNTLVEGFADSVNIDGEEEIVGAGSSGFIVNSYGGYSKKGYAPYNPKKKNQDALIMAEDPKTRSLLFCVMDGHGEDGDKVSQSIKSKLANYLFKHRDFATDIKAALADVIQRCEGEVLREASIETDFSGTTFTCAVIRGNNCTLCNVGDSRTSLAYRNKSGGVTAVALTIDHKPDLPAEKARIEGKGGRVFAVEYDDGVDGPARVWLGHMDVPGLAMSRSLGDAVAHTAGVSSEPEFFEYEFNPDREDLIMVMASDGLWEFMSDQEVMEIAYNTTEPRFAVDRLISESNERWMREEQVIDDTTVCVAFLGNFQAGAAASSAAK
jgi:serine/threonine protein phosphatase PrpC